MPASVSCRTGYAQRPFTPSFIKAGATATTSPTYFPSAARWRGSFPVRAIIHVERCATQSATSKSCRPALSLCLSASFRSLPALWQGEYSISKLSGD